MIKVKDIMTRGVITISKDASIIEAAKKIVPKSVSGLVVVENGSPVGIISESGIIKGILNKKMKVKDAMDNEYTVISPSTRFSYISDTLRKKKIKRFPVVEDGKLTGLVTETDVIEATRGFTRMHQIMQEIILIIFGLATAFFLFYFSPLGASIFGRV